MERDEGPRPGRSRVSVRVTGEDQQAVEDTKAVIRRALLASGARRVPEPRRLRLVASAEEEER